MGKSLIGAVLITTLIYEALRQGHRHQPALIFGLAWGERDSLSLVALKRLHIIPVIQLKSPEL